VGACVIDQGAESRPGPESVTPCSFHRLSARASCRINARTRRLANIEARLTSGNQTIVQGKGRQLHVQGWKFEQTTESDPLKTHAVSRSDAAVRARLRVVPPTAITLISEASYSTWGGPPELCSGHSRGSNRHTPLATKTIDPDAANTQEIVRPEPDLSGPMLFRRPQADREKEHPGFGGEVGDDAIKRAVEIGE